MRNSASPALVYHASMDLACTYALRRPRLARELASDALHASIALGAPDLTARANEFLCALECV